MKIKFKLSLIVIAIETVIVAGIAIILLRQASATSLRLSQQSIKNLARTRAEYWKGREDGNLKIMKTLADVMADFESIPVETRRDRFDAMMRSTLVANSNLSTVYTVWKPNVIDGNDSRYIGRTGSTPTGQYASAFDRGNNGQIIHRTTTDVDGAMGHFISANALNDRVLHPQPFTVNGKDTYVIRLFVPIVNHETSEVVGGVGCFIDIDIIQPIVQNTIGMYDEIIAMAIYSGNGFIIACYRPERIGTMLIDTETHYGDFRTQANNAVLKGQEYSCSSYAPLLKTNMESVMVPIKIGSSDTTWTIMIGTSEEYIMKDVWAIQRLTIILAAIAIIGGAAVVYIALGATTNSIVKVASVLKIVAQGDLNQNINVKSKDEIGDLSRDFNSTMDKIRTMIGGVKKHIATLHGVGDSLSSSMTQSAAAVNEITANIQSIKDRIINQSASVTQTNATMEQVSNNIRKLNTLIENQSENVTQSSSSIEEMVATINSVTDTLIKNSANIRTLSESSETGRTGLQDVAQDIREIARESEGLMEINAVMESIASQTNLLSMNAAIEAAHAGEAGKGFAVVADEIRKLAESSSEQSKTIGNVLQKIKESMDKITGSTENVLKEFEAIDANIKNVAEQADSIRTAMEEEGEGSKQLLSGVSNLNQITRQVRDGSGEMANESKEVINESRNLEKATQEITMGINEMAQGANEINVAIHQVNDLGVQNRESIDALLKEVSWFRV
ncbi:MAG: methyl-accepting chemotaxis protein [Treponema sp.]|jgi:methyl-accepting chemotaxis protein|nr:methyl-accepting chemotaxis protein [Treponema sp.]